MYSATEKISEEIKAHTIFATSKSKDWIRHIADRYFRELFRRTTGEVFDVLSIVPVQVLKGEKKQEVCEFHEIFQRCLTPSKEGVHLLLEGRAGVGKSTMMKLLAHFSGAVVLDEKVEHPLYQEAKTLLSRFPLVLSIPLKELEGDYPIHWKEYIFQEMGIREEEKEELNATLKSLCSKREVLFLLDGFDGVKESLDFQATGIEQVLRLQDWVMTSRPDHYQEKRVGEVQRFELVGLSSEGVPKFIHAYFSDWEEAEALIQFISQSHQLSTIATIPFLLEILCHSWKEDRKRVFENTSITTLYGLLVFSIVKKYLQPELGTKIAYLTSLEKLLIDRTITHKTSRTCVSIFIQILERFAFRQLAIEEKKYVFLRTDPYLLDLISGEIGAFKNERVISEGDTGLAMDLIFDQLGLFRSLNPHRGEFLHSSLQEYFAGRHLATCIEKSLPVGGISWQEWVDNNRFNPEYSTVFRFAIGVLDERMQSEKLKDFFTLFLDPKRGSFFRFHEACLAASFLEEVKNVEVPQRESVVERIANWIRWLEFFPQKLWLGNSLNSDFLHSLSILNHPTIVRTISDLSQESRMAKDEMMELCNTLQLNSQEFLGQLTAILEDPNAREREVAAETLGNLGIHFPRVVETLLRFSEDGDRDVRISCIRALGSRERKKRNFLSATLYFMQKIGLAKGRKKEAQSKTDLDAELAQRVVNLLVDRLLNDPSEKVRGVAAKTLGHLQITEPRVIEALVRCVSSSRLGCKCIQALGLLGIRQREVQDLLVESLKDPHIALAAFKALGNIGWSDDPTIAALENMAQSRNSSWQEAALLALRQIQPPSWRDIDRLIELSQSAEYFERLTAAHALESHVHTSEAAVRAYIRMISDKGEDEKLRIRSLVALDRLEKKSPVLLDSLVLCLVDSSPKVRCLVIRLFLKENYLNDHVIENMLEGQTKDTSGEDHPLMNGIETGTSDADSPQGLLGWLKFVGKAVLSSVGHVLSETKKSGGEALTSNRSLVLKAIAKSGTKSTRAMEFLKEFLKEEDEHFLLSIQALLQLFPESEEAMEAFINFLQKESFDKIGLLCWTTFVSLELPEFLRAVRCIIPRVCRLLNHQDREIRNNIFDFLNYYEFDEYIQWYSSAWISKDQFLMLAKRNIEVKTPLVYSTNTHFVYVDRQNSKQFVLTKFPFLEEIFSLRGSRSYRRGIKSQQKESHEEAFQAFQLASQEDLEGAHFRLGYCYYWGLGVEIDKEKAKEYFTRAFAKGHLEAGCFLEVFYQINRDPELGEDVYEAEASHWDPDERGFLSTDEEEADLEESMQFGDRNPEKYVEIGKYYLKKELNRVAFRMFQRAAEMNSAVAHWKLAKMIGMGLGVVENLDRAIIHLRQAAEGGLRKSMLNLACVFDYGEVVERNLKEAVKFYKMASDRGDLEARGLLATLYQCEEEVRDLEEAFRLFESAATEGNEDAIFGLGFCYEVGEGIPKNLQKAEELYDRATQHGLLRGWKAMQGSDQRLTIFQDPRKVEIVKRLDYEDSIRRRAVELKREAAKLLLNAAHFIEKTVITFARNAVQGGDKMAIPFLALVLSKQGRIKEAASLYEKEVGRSLLAEIDRSYLDFAKLDRMKSSLDKKQFLLLSRLADFYQTQNIRPKRTFSLFHLASLSEDVGALFGLGFCYELGEGIPKNLEKAKELYTKAIELGILEMWKEKKLVYQNPRKVQVLRRLAIERGDTVFDVSAGDENFRMGLEAEFGDQPDTKKAQVFYSLAADKGHAGAIERLNHLEEGELDE